MTNPVLLTRAVGADVARTMCKVVFTLLAVLAGCSAWAQLPLQAVGSPFDMTGFLESATVDVPGDVLSGGTLSVNGTTITVPRNTILQMPALALTWQQVFSQAPPPYGPSQTGLAMNDTPAPLTTYEIHVQGNRLGNAYIAGLIFFSQQSLNSGQGFINFMDYANGEMRVGGIIGNPVTGTRVKINDPSGRFAPVYNGDPRFTIDTDNPTIRTETGYPMGFPHFDPSVQNDPLIPQSNRPLTPGTTFYQTVFTMPPPGAGITPDSRLAAPFEVGDYVTFAGCLMKDGPAPTVGPMPAGGVGTYVAAHTIIANVGIFTAPGSNPAYVAVDVMLLGVGGAPIAGIPQEATARTRFEGFTTDASRVVDLFGMDANSNSTVATITDRNWGSIDVDPGPLAVGAIPGSPGFGKAGAVQGRWRFRPPSKVLAMPAAGVFLPATRNMRAVLRGAYSAGNPVISGNGLITGQYNAPIFDFLFPENLAAGGAPVPLNFIDFPFLTNGTAGFSGFNVGQLTPWPGSTTPAGVPQQPPQAPVANAGIAQTAPSGTVVTLNGSASADPAGSGLAYAWTQIANGAPTVTLLNAATATPSFTAPVLTAPATSAVLAFQLIVTNTALLASAPAGVNVTVTVPVALVAPVANAGAAQTVASGAIVQLNGLASSDPNIPASPITFKWTQTGLGGLPAVTLSSATAATPTFSAPVVKTGLPVVITFQLTVTNAGQLTSSASVNITVNPAVPPLANAGFNQGVKVGAAVKLDGSFSTDPNGLPLTFNWVQVSGTAVVLANANTATPTFTAPATVGVLGFTLTVNNGVLNSTPALVTITVNAAVNDVVTITVAEYRIGQQRLTVTATDSIVDGTPVLTLLGYGPNNAGVVMPYLGGGLYTLVLSGVQQPASVKVTSSFGGSATSGLTKLRQ